MGLTINRRQAPFFFFFVVVYTVTDISRSGQNVDRSSSLLWGPSFSIGHHLALALSCPKSALTFWPQSMTYSKKKLEYLLLQKLRISPFSRPIPWKSFLSGHWERVKSIQNYKNTSLRKWKWEISSELFHFRMKWGSKWRMSWDMLTLALSVSFGARRLPSTTQTAHCELHKLRPNRHRFQVPPASKQCRLTAIWITVIPVASFNPNAQRLTGDLSVNFSAFCKLKLRISVATRSLSVGFWQNGFFAAFYFWAAGFFRGFVAGFFLLILVGKSAQKNPPGKSPAKSSKIYTTNIPNTFLQRGWAKKSFRLRICDGGI